MAERAAKKKKNIRAKVNARLLTKASRLFTGTIEGRITEILQNARRAGANHVRITNNDGEVIVEDNGRGIDDFGKILDLGGSGWDENLEVSEDPAGVGLFCLAPRQVTIRSNGKKVVIPEGEGWTGGDVQIEQDSERLAGTRIEFKDTPWTLEAVQPHAVFSGLQVIVDCAACLQQPFVTEDAVHYKELGCRIEVCAYAELSEWHRPGKRKPWSEDNVIVNFHGQALSFVYHPLSNDRLCYLVDLTSEPTGIRLMLPARTQLVENDALESLRMAIELEAYRYYQRLGTHSLPYNEYLRAQELNIWLPEATQTYTIGLLHPSDYIEPVCINVPKGLTLADCYRFDRHRTWKDYDHANVHLLAALGALDKPFVPVEICPDYDGYSWTKLAKAVDDVSVECGKVIFEDWLWMERIACVDSISITVRTSDGKVFSSPVCMAKLPIVPGSVSNEPAVCVTRNAKERVSTTEIWYHLGGCDDEYGDTFKTRLCDFREALERFWADVIGPDEHLRQEIVESCRSLPAGWKQVSVTADEVVTITADDGQVKTLRPPPEPARAAA